MQGSQVRSLSGQTQAWAQQGFQARLQAGLVFGLNISSDSHVPLSCKLFDGSTTDDVTHIPDWNALRTLLGN
jgi:hypothetical protein